MAKRIPSLYRLARRDDPLADIATVLERLLRSKNESRYLEWAPKSPLDPWVTTGARYRMVKAAISFANWEGGFVVFGVDSDGRWVGLSHDDLEHTDPAGITELVNSCVFPEIPNFNYAELIHEDEQFLVLHVPASDSAPHVTTHQVIETDEEGNKKVVVAKRALYCRHGGKSELATPHQHQKIVSNRTESLRGEMIRRMDEVRVHIAKPVKATAQPRSTTLRIARLSQDPTAPALRLTRAEGGPGEVYLHEELYEGLFDEINNVLDANKLLARGRKEFLLGEEIYYRIYAERQHVKADPEELELLARTALHEIYSPSLYWFARMPGELFARIVVDFSDDIKSPHVHSFLRLVTLLGPGVSDWLYAKFDRKWGKYSQPPDYFWSFQKLRERTEERDRILVALRTTAAATIILHDHEETPPIGTLLESPRTAATYLSQTCMLVFEGRKDQRNVARMLDIVAYGREIERRGKEVEAEIGKLEEVTERGRFV